LSGRVRGVFAFPAPHGGPALPVPDPVREGRLLRIDAARGGVTDSHRTASEPTDLLAAP
jgi:hypothetical protein